MRGAAIVCTVIAACGGDSREEPPGAISVTVRASGVPVAGVPVWFQEADATLVLTTETNAQGSAAALVSDDAVVSVLTAYSVDGIPKPLLQTFVGVRVGDELVIDEPSEEAASRAIEVELPPDGLATSYSVSTSCGYVDAPAPSVSTYLSGCGADVALLATSYDDSYASLAYIYVPPAPIVDRAMIDLRAQTWQPFAPLPISLVDFVGKKEAYLDPALVGDGLIALAGGLVDLRPGEASRIMRRPPIDATLGLRATIVSAGSLSFIDHVWIWGQVDSFAVTGSEVLPPSLAPTIDLDRRALVWPSPTGGTFVDVRVQRNDQQGQVWRVVGPTDGLVLQLPALPPALDRFEPHTGYEYDLAGVVIDSTVGYEGLRPGIMNRRAHPYIAGPQGRTVVHPFGL